MGRPAHLPEPSERRQVEVMAGYGVPEPDIARVLSIDPKTLAPGTTAGLASRHAAPYIKGERPPLAAVQSPDHLFRGYRLMETADHLTAELRNLRRAVVDLSQGLKQSGTRQLGKVGVGIEETSRDLL